MDARLTVAGVGGGSWGGLQGVGGGDGKLIKLSLIYPSPGQAYNAVSLPALLCLPSPPIFFRLLPSASSIRLCPTAAGLAAAETRR